MPQNCLHFCSTPRNVYLALGYALAHTQYQHHLVLIDQVPDKTNPFLVALDEQANVFTSVAKLHKGKGFWSKRAARKKAFKTVAQLLDELPPSLITIGNDRRVEFQYCMHLLALKGSDCKAVYLEDGINSYLDANVIRKKLRPFSDVFIEPLAKRLSYGGWYDRGEFVGCSRWISQRLLTFPELLSNQDGPKASKLSASLYKSDAFVDEISRLMQTAYGEVNAVKGDLLILMPHSRDLIADNGSAAEFLAKITPLLQKESKPFVKYHPNETTFVLEGLAEPLPHKLPMEMLLSLCEFDCYVGDTSAAVLNVKWLNSEAHVVSVDNGNPSNTPLFELMAKVDISIVQDFSHIQLDH